VFLRSSLALFLLEEPINYWKQFARNNVYITDFTEALHKVLIYFIPAYPLSKIEWAVDMFICDLQFLELTQELKMIFGNVITKATIQDLVRGKKYPIKDIKMLSNYSYYILYKQAEGFLAQTFWQIFISNFSKKSKNFDKIMKNMEKKKQFAEAKEEFKSEIVKPVYKEETPEISIMRFKPNDKSKIEKDLPLWSRIKTRQHKLNFTSTQPSKEYKQGNFILTFGFLV
jgi:hypothetical protein